MGKEIAAARRQAGLTQSKMSELMDIPKRTIENWESGKSVPPPYVKRLVINELNRISLATKEL